MTFSLRSWAAKWNVPLAALQEMEAAFGTDHPPRIDPSDHAPGSEARQQSLITLEAARLGIPLLRNNVGALQAEWHNFQKFAEWYSKQWKEEGWQIGKDLKVRYNRVYSKDNCLLLPSRINGLIIRHALKGELPTGIQLKGGRYYARVGTLDVRVSLGGFDTPEDAYEVYLKAKYEYIKILVVGKYSYLPESIKKYLLDWRV